MTERRWIKPLVGRVPTPDRGTLPAAGDQVDWDNYWQRRMNDRDIAFMSDAEIKAAEKARDKPEGYSK
jgi:hypothetical protein